MKPLASNTLLQNRYLIVHLIGKGGMGEVYLAVDQRLGSPVALKRTFFSDNEMLGNAFEREAKTLARLRHNVLPKVSDHFIEGDHQYLIMEHIAGEDLAKRLEALNKPFPLSWVMYWADQLLDALNYLHSHEPPIIHRDIKPQNLKLTEENSIVLLDFGLSKNSLDVSRIATTTGSIVGYTPHYAPMEQIRGTGTNARSDIYSLSSTLYQLLTNTVPPDALTRADALLGEMPDPLKPINEINPEVSDLISQTVSKGMEVSRDKRFSSAREMQRVLRDAYAQTENQIAVRAVAVNSPNQMTANKVITTPATAFSFEGENASVQMPKDIDQFDSTTPAGANTDHFATFTPPKTYSRPDSEAGEKVNGQSFSKSLPNIVPTAFDEKKSRRNSLFIFGGIGALLLTIAAVAFTFYASNPSKTITDSDSVTKPGATIEFRPSPTIESVSTTNVNSNSVNEKPPNTNSTAEVAEKPSIKTSESYNNVKPVPSTSIKVNPKPALPAAAPRLSVKPTPITSPKTTPLPRILP